MSMMDEFGWEVWVVAALAGLVCMLLVRSPARWRGVLPRLTVFAAATGAIIGYFQWATDRDLAAERRALQIRQADLAARALTPGSPLACLDGDAGEAVETACENALFARPETAAAAVIYVTARLSLLSDALALDDTELAPTVAGLRRALELDRYGIAAHVLANRDGCNLDQCVAFTWVSDPTALKANLKARAFDGYVQRYEAVWKKQSEEGKSPAVAAVSPPADGSAAAGASASGADASTVAPAQAGHVPLSSRYDFPSSASIPAVSIMNKEPAAGAASSAGSAGQAQGADGGGENLPVPPRRPHTQGTAPQ